MDEIAALSDRLIVMSEHSSRFLQEVFRVPEEKIDLIPHGVPDLPFGDPNYYKDSFGTEGKAVLLTFGLLSPNHCCPGKLSLSACKQRRLSMMHAFSSKNDLKCGKAVKACLAVFPGAATMPDERRAHHLFPIDRVPPSPRIPEVRRPLCG
jgi:hypothetical protein